MSVEPSERGGKGRRNWGGHLPPRLWIVVGMAAIGAAACGSSSTSGGATSTNAANINPTSFNEFGRLLAEGQRQRHRDGTLHAHGNAEPGRLHRRLRDARPAG